MSLIYQIEVTDTFSGVANYSTVRRLTLVMPELPHYGYDGATNYASANARYQRALMRRAKAAMGWSGIRCNVERYGDTIELRPRNGTPVIAFITRED